MDGARGKECLAGAGRRRRGGEGWEEEKRAARRRTEGGRANGSRERRAYGLGRCSRKRFGERFARIVGITGKPPPTLVVHSSRSAHFLLRLPYRTHRAIERPSGAFRLAYFGARLPLPSLFSSPPAAPPPAVSSPAVPSSPPVRVFVASAGRWER